MMAKRLNAFILTFSLFLACVFITPLFAKEVVRDVRVSARVPSTVSPEHSTIQLSKTQAVADPTKDQPVFLTVYLRDAKQKPLPKVEVTLTSSRGDLDVIEAVSKLSLQNHYALRVNVSKMKSDLTDSDGKVSFRVSSFTPGEVVLLIKADSGVTLPAQTIRFLPTSLWDELTITFPLLGTDKEIALLNPEAELTKDLSPLQLEARRKVHVDAKVRVPGWLLVLTLFAIINIVGFLMFVLAMLGKIKRLEHEEVVLLRKIFHTKKIERLKKSLIKNGFNGGANKDLKVNDSEKSTLIRPNGK